MTIIGVISVQMTMNIAPLLSFVCDKNAHFFRAEIEN
jgi:hypothetical protein